MGASNELIGRVFLSHLSPEQRRATLDEKEAAYRDGPRRYRADCRRRRAARFRRPARPEARRRHQRAARQRRDGACRARARSAPADRRHRVGAARVQAGPAALPDRASSGPARSRRVRSPSRIRPRAFAPPSAAGLAVVGLTTTLTTPTLIERGRDHRGERFHRSAHFRADRSAHRAPSRKRESSRMRLAQFVDDNGKRALAVTARGESRLVKGARTTLDLARQAIESEASRCAS